MEQNSQSSENNTEIKLDSEGEPIEPRAKKGAKIKIVLFVFIIIAVLVGAGVYFFVLNKKDDAVGPKEEENVEIVKDEEEKTAEIDKTLDTDQDKLPDYLEEIIGTDKNKADTDGDSYDDLTEIKNGYDPLSDGKYTAEEWKALRKNIKKADAELYAAIFIDSNFNEKEVLTFTGDLADWNDKMLSITQKVTLKITSDNRSKFEEDYLSLGDNGREVITKKAGEVLSEGDLLSSNSLILTGNIDSNSIMAQVYEKASVVDIKEVFEENNNIGLTVKLADNPWIDGEKIIMFEENYSMGETISAKGKIRVENRGEYSHIILDDGVNNYALIRNSDYLEEIRLEEFDGKEVEITGYKRINNSKKIQFEDSMGVMDIEISE